MKQSQERFGDALRALMDERGHSFRSLAEATRDIDGKGVTHAHLNMLANGHEKPSPRVMEILAALFGIQPDYFVEYRLHRAMRDLDPEAVGFEQALKNLNARLAARRAATKRK